MRYFCFTTNSNTMSKNAKFIGQPIFSQLLKFIPKQKIVQLSNSHQSDRYIKRFKTYDHLVTMLYGVFHNCRSLREVVTGMMACHGKLQHLGLSDYSRRSTLSDANKRRESKVFEDIYYSLHRLYGSFLSDSRSIKGHLEKRLFIVDSTTISLFQEILRTTGQGPANGKRKGGIKVHTLIKADQDVPCLVNMTSAVASDNPFLKYMNLPKHSIVVFDRGYNSYVEMERLDKDELIWITRKHPRAVMELQSANQLTPQERSNGIVKDHIVVLGSPKNKSQLRVAVRWIEFYDVTSGKTLEFLTNNRTMKPSTIAQLYQRRWQIETFFKRLKQNNQLKYFLGDNENAIRIQIWCSLIADLIIKVIQNRVKRKWSFANLSSMIRIHLMSYTSLMHFLENPEHTNFQTPQSSQLDLFSSV